MRAKEGVPRRPDVLEAFLPLLTPDKVREQVEEEYAQGQNNKLLCVGSIAAALSVAILNNSSVENWFGKERYEKIAAMVDGLSQKIRSLIDAYGESQSSNAPALVIESLLQEIEDIRKELQ